MHGEDRRPVCLQPLMRVNWGDPRRWCLHEWTHQKVSCQDTWLIMRFINGWLEKQHIHSIEKTLSCENHKTLTMRPNSFMGRLSFAYSKYKTVLCSFVDWCESHVTIETVQAKLKVTNKAQFERFKGQNLTKYILQTVKRYGRLALFRLPRATRISHKPELLVFWICKWLYTSNHTCVGSHL